MIFRPELAEKIREGQKTVTRRLPSENPRSPWWRDRCGLNVGSYYAVCPGRGKPAVCRVRVIRPPEKVRLGLLTHVEAWREGFRNRADFEDTWAALHGSYDPDLLVWRVQFTLVAEVVAIDG